MIKQQTARRKKGTKIRPSRPRRKAKGHSAKKGTKIRARRPRRKAKVHSAKKGTKIRARRPGHKAKMHTAKGTPRRDATWVGIVRFGIEWLLQQGYWRAVLASVILIFSWQLAQAASTFIRGIFPP
jgi:hypothetical protein